MEPGISMIVAAALVLLSALPVYAETLFLERTTFTLPPQMKEVAKVLEDTGTNFDLKDDEVDLLIKAADEVLRGSSEFQAFLKRANGRLKLP